jgi:hypothetical protein
VGSGVIQLSRDRHDPETCSAERHGFMLWGVSRVTSQIDLLGCEYLGGCPALGARVLNKAELHFDATGLTVAVAPQGLFTLAGARARLSLTWAEITTLSTTSLSPPSTAAGRVARRVRDVLAMRLDLPDQLEVGTPEWTMTVGVRTASGDLARALQGLTETIVGPTPAITRG